MQLRAFLPNASWLHVLWSDELRDPPVEWSDLLAVPGVRFFPKQLEIPWTAWVCPELIDFCRTYGLTVPVFKDKYQTVRIWDPARPVFSHQPELAKRLLQSTRVLCADEMGLGKTASAIQAAETVRRHVHHYQRPVVIFGPLRARKVWLRELTSMGAIESPEQFCALESTDMASTSFRKGALYYFVHYDVIDTWWSRLVLERPCVSIADEVHLLKNGRALRTKMASVAIQAAPFRILLTGTPIQNHPEDLWSLLTILCGERNWGSPIAFRQRYCGAVQTQFGYKDTGPTCVEELQERLAPFYLRRRREDAGVQLPDFRREIVDVQVSALKKRDHATLLGSLSPTVIARMVDALLKGSLLPDALKALSRMRASTSQAKLPATLELAQSVLDQDGAVVVFTWERKTADWLQNKLDKAYPAMTGALSIQQRDARIDTFQANGGAIVATYGALAEGVTLHRARTMILHDIDWVPATMLQSERRIHRIGQDKACTCYWMVAHELFDALLLQALRTKLADTELILNIEQAVPEICGDAGPDTFEARMQAQMQAWRTQ